MAILDAQNLFMTSVALPSSSSTVASTNMIDLGSAGKVFGTTNPMFLLFIWTGTPIGTSIRIDLASTASATDITSTPTVHWSTGIVPQASYAAVGFAGTATVPTFSLIAMPNGSFNPGIQSTGGVYKRYIGLAITVVGDTSAGILTAALVQAADIRAYAASGFTGPT